MTELKIDPAELKPDDFIFRLIRKEDLPELEWEGEYTHFRRVYAEAYRRSLRGDTLLWGIELPGFGIVGQAFVLLDCGRNELANGKDRAYIYSFRVRPQFRSMGLGSRLLRIIENDLIRRGVRVTTLNVAKDNQRARELYERRGYRVVSHEPGKWSYQDHEGKWRSVVEPSWRMQKNLSDTYLK